MEEFGILAKVDWMFADRAARENVRRVNGLRAMAVATLDSPGNWDSPGAGEMWAGGMLSTWAEAVWLGDHSNEGSRMPWHFGVCVVNAEALRLLFSLFSSNALCTLSWFPRRNRTCSAMDE